jgi:hypothetical protein
MTATAVMVHGYNSPGATSPLGSLRLDGARKGDYRGAFIRLDCLRYQAAQPGVGRRSVCD